MGEHIDSSSLRSALSSLEDGLDVVSDAPWFNAQADKVKTTLIAGVTQNFEFVYDISFKMMRRQIEAEAASPTDVDESNFAMCCGWRPKRA